MTVRGRALVTGASGFVGSYLVKELLAEGWQVRALVRRPSELDRFGDRRPDCAIGDLHDREALAKALAGCSHVFHLAAETAPPTWRIGTLRAANVDGTERVVRGALDAGVERFVHRSSTGVYGRVARGPATLDTPARPDSPYRHSKWRAERVVESFRRRHGLPAVVARTSTAYGPGSPNRLPLFRDLLAERFCLYGDGANRDHPVYAGDLARGLRLCGEVPGIEGRTYLLAGREAVPVRAEVEAMERRLGHRGTWRRRPRWPLEVLRGLLVAGFRVTGRDLGLVERLDFFLSDRCFDVSRARDELGYAPAVGIDEGLEHVHRWYRQQGWLP